MKRGEFLRRHEATWQRTEDVLDRLDQGRRIEHELGELPALYRRCCHHLSIARQRHYDAEVVRRLHRIALRGYRRLYRRRGDGWRGVFAFLGAGFPRLVRRHAASFWLATLLFYGPGLAMGLFVLDQPMQVYALLDAETVEEIESMYRSRQTEERGADVDFQMFGYYVYNNIGIALRTFASGLLLGVGTLVILVFNGLFFGAVFAHLANEGIVGHLFTFVITHGAFELTAIVIAGVAGLRLGGAILSPGRRRRLDALRAVAPQALALALGAVFLLFLAAFLEAFWSSAVWVTPPVKIAIGSAAWVAVALYLGFGGRRGDAAGVPIEPVTVSP